MKVFAVAALVAIIAVVGASAQAYCTGTCSSSTCDAVVCGFAAPYRCNVGGVVACHMNPPQQGFCDSCCDARSCATSRCKASCPAEACHTAHCGGKAPWACYKGESRNGCADTPKQWENNTICGACCDMTSCPKTTPAPGAPPAPANFTCHHACTKAQCSYQYRCAFDTPYTCSAGRSLNGCSANASFWPSEPAFCTSCCDVRTCAFACTECSASLCEAPLCPPTAPYTCTAGISAGGCSASAAHWGKEPTCSSCCYCPAGSKNAGKKLLF